MRPGHPKARGWWLMPVAYPFPRHPMKLHEIREQTNWADDALGLKWGYGKEEDAAVDLMTALMHWMELRELDVVDLHDRAKAHYLAERRELMRRKPRQARRPPGDRRRGRATR